MRWILLTLLIGLPALGQVVLSHRRIVPTSILTISGATNDMVGFWNLDEAVTNSVRVDICPNNGIQSITNRASGTTSFEAGKITNAVKLRYTSVDGLTSSDTNFSVQGSISFAWAGWALSKTNGTQRAILSKTQATPGYSIHWDSPADGPVKFTLFSTNGATEVTVTNTSGGTWTTNVWYYVAAWVDRTNSTMNISLNGGPVDSQTFNHTIGNMSAAEFQLGLWGAANWSGLLDEWAFWKRALTTNEITSYYNAGVGKTYPLP